MRNDANDRGAKLLAGSPNWTDYTVEGDVQLLGAGSAGVLGRVSEAEVGENSHKGYFAGVRTVDNSLVLGAYDFAYHEAAKVTLPDPVRPLRWYHVKLKADGCFITASVSAAGMRELTTTPLNDSDCFRSGRIGLRSNGTGGVWRNVTVAAVDSTAAPGNSAAQRLPLSERSRHACRWNSLRTGSNHPIVAVSRSLRLALASVHGTVPRPAIYAGSHPVGPEIQTATNAASRWRWWKLAETASTGSIP
jgi:hypothetical protein